MSVLINMEMPTSCSDCPIGDSLCCTLMPGVPALWKEYTLAIKTNRRHEDCPLVPVPKHGRLIDADALLEWANAGLRFGDPDFHAGLWHTISAIEDATTIIPADRRERDV